MTRSGHRRRSMQGKTSAPDHERGFAPASRTALAKLIILFVSMGVTNSAMILAQDQPPPDSPAPVNVDAIIREAQEKLDRIDVEVDPTARKALMDEVAAQIEALRTEQNSNPWLFYLSGRLNAALGRRADARDQLRRFVESREGRNEWSAYRTLGDLFEEYPRLAKYNYTRALELKPSEPSVLWGLSICEYRLSDLEAARQRAQEAVSADGRRTIRYLAQLSTVLSAQKKWSLAEVESAAALEQAEIELRDRPGSRIAAQNVMTQVEILVNLAQQIIQDAPSEPATYLRISRYLNRRMELMRVLAFHDHLAIFEPGIKSMGAEVPEGLRLAYAESLAEVGKHAEAIQQFEAVLGRNPTNAEARKWLERLGGKPPTP